MKETRRTQADQAIGKGQDDKTINTFYYRNDYCQTANHISTTKGENISARGYSFIYYGLLA